MRYYFISRQICNHIILLHNLPWSFVTRLLRVVNATAIYFSEASCTGIELLLYLKVCFLSDVNLK